MSTYEPEELLSLWKRERLDLAMAMGHLLQHLVILHRPLFVRPKTDQPTTGDRKSDQAGTPHDQDRD